MPVDMELSVRFIDDKSIADAQPENPFFKLVSNQRLAIVNEFCLESGRRLREVPVAFKTWGRLNEQRNNVMVICHALSGSADVEDWWAPLLGRHRAFDPTRFFIFCANVLGSPYGTASPCTLNPDTGRPYGADFPLTTIRDDVRLHRIVLDALGVSQVAVCIGGSMGGMQVLEWAALFGPKYVRNIVPIATCGRHSAWGISWGEAQRRAIYSDPLFNGGHYTHENQPKQGLAAARMTAMLTYRSRDSFVSRFGRRKMIPKNYVRTNAKTSENQDDSAKPTSANEIFSAQSYLRYQGAKFCDRFDANCYIAITHKMDTHDLSRDRDITYEEAVTSITQPALVLGVESDGLFTISEQYELADLMPEAEMSVINSPDGHDGFLLEFDQLNSYILQFLRRVLPELAPPERTTEGEGEGAEDTETTGGLRATKTSLFGEAEADVTCW